MKCFNPDCLCQNPNNNNFCQKCGQKLLLTERYRGLKYLGEGGFGRTFIGIDQNRRNSHCVIKQFLPFSQGSGALQKCIQLFEQEAELLEKLGKHPQIPDLLAFFEQDKKLYLIQEYIEGQDLLKELQTKGRFSENNVKSLLLEMLPVLDFIHTKSVIHRDIKPENILRRKNNIDHLIYGQISDLVLIDFGISKQVSATVITKLGTAVGTPGYASPEQSRGLVVPSSDLYSLAVTAIRLLTGVFPQERNGSIVDEIFDVYNLSWIWKEWLGKNRLSIDKNLANILDKMLADRVNDRFQSAQEVLAVLQPSFSAPKIELQSIQQQQFSSHNTTIQQEKVTNSPAQNSPKPIIKLQTSKADFTRLEQLLAQGKWKEADQETAQLMLRIMGREKEGWLNENNCKNFPYNELKIIDDLWVKYSNDKFGFSIQMQVWLESGGQLDVYNHDIYKSFGDYIGWRIGENWKRYYDLTSNTNAEIQKRQKGHLPYVIGVGRFRQGIANWGMYVLFLFSNLNSIQQQKISSQSNQQPKQKPLISSPNSIIQQAKVINSPAQNLPKNITKLQTSKADFTQLYEFLATKNWKEADQETANIVFKIVDRQEKLKSKVISALKSKQASSFNSSRVIGPKDSLDFYDCINFPDKEFKIIDDLWLKHSNGRFGFSVQKKIWFESGGTFQKFNGNVYLKFCDYIGWRKEGNWMSYSDLTFKTSAPKGHFPCGGKGCWIGIQVKRWWGLDTVQLVVWTPPLMMFIYSK